MIVWATRLEGTSCELLAGRARAEQRNVNAMFDQKAEVYAGMTIWDEQEVRYTNNSDMTLSDFVSRRPRRVQDDERKAIGAEPHLVTNSASVVRQSVSLSEVGCIIMLSCRPGACHIWNRCERRAQRVSHRFLFRCEASPAIFRA